MSLKIKILLIQLKEELKEQSRLKMLGQVHHLQPQNQKNKCYVWGK